MKRFFYTSAAVLMLAIVYALGARNAAGQSRPHIEAITYDSGAMYVVVSGEWRWVDVHTGNAVVSYPLPTNGPVVVAGNHLVVYQDGSLYVHEGAPGSWVLKGNVVGR